MDIGGLRLKLKKHGQEHLLDHWNSLDHGQKKNLYNEILSLNLEELNKTFLTAMQGHERHINIDDTIQPIPNDLCGNTSTCSTQQMLSYRKTGLSAISDGEVCVILLAGGQGTRLGVPYPKGMYDVGLISAKTLYQIQGERLLRVQTLAERENGKCGNVTWYIMTSEHTKEPTQRFFEANKYFGLDPNNVVVFEQGQMPAFTFDGKIILSAPDKLALSPDGNGGLYQALHSEKIIDDMKGRGIKYCYVYCVDNILVRMADPEFIGFCIQRSFNCAAVVVEKESASESVGVVCKVRDIYEVVEYSEISSKTSEKRNSDGSLVFAYGNICNHFLTTSFLNDCAEQHKSKLKYHVAKKKVPHAAEDGSIVHPSVPNAIKMEKFVFDVFQFSKNFGVWVVRRDQAFSPLKNATGANSCTPASCRESLYKLHATHILQAKGKLQHEDGTPVQLKNGFFVEFNDHGHPICEISPLVSYDGEDLEEFCEGKTFTVPLALERDASGKINVQSHKDV